MNIFGARRRNDAALGRTPICGEADTVNVTIETDPVTGYVELKINQNFAGGRGDFCARVDEVKVFVGRGNASIEADPERVEGRKEKVTGC